MTDRYVFVSYSRRDAAAIVDRLTSALTDRGVRVWRDVNEIEAGESWQRAIEKGLKGASALLYVASRGSSGSDWMNEELATFHAQGKLIIPLVIDDAGHQAMPFLLQRYQWLDLRQGFDRVVDRIVEAVGGEVSIGAPVERKAQKSKGYVFLNYSEDDSDFVKELKEFLKVHGYAFWDYEDSDRDYHGQLFLELENVISNSAATLAVLSESWKRSKWTVKEYFFSEEVGIPVFLLRAKEMAPTLAVAGIPYIDFVGDSAGGFAKLDKELRRKNL